MKPDPSARAVPILVFLALSALMLTGLASIPFHPDETSWLVQSRDLEGFATDPLSLAWRSDTPVDPDMSYRLLNAPLAKYILAAARVVTGVPPQAVEQDWAWSADWLANVNAGAIPDDSVLWAARFASSLLTLGACAALYAAGNRMGVRWTGLVSAVLLATNGLALLHGRRSMAEGALLLGVSLVVVGILWADRYPWLAGLMMGLALCAKQSTLPLMPIGALAVLWVGGPSPSSLGGAAKRLAFYIAALVLTWIVFNPVVWVEPVGALQAMISERAALLQAQRLTFASQGSSLVIDSAIDRWVGLLAATFFAPPQASESANYAAMLAADQAAYMASIWRGMPRGLVAGGLSFVLTLLGIALGLAGAVRAEANFRRELVLLLLLTAAQVAGLVAAVPLAFQRYYMPVVPLVSLWMGYAVAAGVQAVQQRRPRQRSARPAN